MQAMIRALKNKDNALLESPTGTGKTLCLLSASVAFIEAYSKIPMYFDKSDDSGKLLHANSSLPTTPTGSQDDKIPPKKSDPLAGLDALLDPEKKDPPKATLDKSKDDKEEQGKKNYLN